MLQTKTLLTQCIEQALRDLIAASEYCELRGLCEVVDVKDCVESIHVKYTTATGERHDIQCLWLVGADGKKGVIRKTFLEPTASIIQEPGIFPYEGTWIAANFKISLPTPQTHPKFPLWKIGYQPQQVYDLFWPTGWHFCSPPGTPVACGRFGPLKDRLWRHEISVPDWKESMNSHDMLMNQVESMVTRSADLDGRKFGTDVRFPLDCIEVLRCRPFRFAHKVVNRWYHNRTILIGDAAHVFPPFGGQGIACGIRDAHGLAWRLAVLLRMESSAGNLAEDLLNRWSQERRQSVYDSSKLTTMSGALCNEEDEGLFFAFRCLVQVISKLPFLSKLITADSIQTYRAGYSPTKTGFHLPCFRGGIRLSQVYAQTSSQDVFLTDHLLQREESIFTLFIVDEYPRNHVEKVQKLIQAMKITPAVLSAESIVMINPNTDSCESFDSAISRKDQIFNVSSTESLQQMEIPKYYDSNSFVKQLRPSTKFVIARPDFIVFACAKSYLELQECLQGFKRHLNLL
jgi:2-polyprenyl-6-methoxyphenol hydroxylase-like FAD-dependent oxidoreductase